MRPSASSASARTSRASSSSSLRPEIHPFDRASKPLGKPELQCSHARRDVREGDRSAVIAVRAVAPPCCLGSHRLLDRGDDLLVRFSSVLSQTTTDISEGCAGVRARSLLLAGASLEVSATETVLDGTMAVSASSVQETRRRTLIRGRRSRVSAEAFGSAAGLYSPTDSPSRRLVAL